MLRNIHFLVFLLGVLSIGIGAGNVFAFLFWHLQVFGHKIFTIFRRFSTLIIYFFGPIHGISPQDIGGSPFLFGIASVVNHAAEIVTFFYAFQIINTYGYVKVITDQSPNVGILYFMLL